MERCNRRCLYRVPDAALGYQCGQGCQYMMVTGKSRTAKVYGILGVKTLTKEALEMLEPENCPCYEFGGPPVEERPAPKPKAETPPKPRAKRPKSGGRPFRITDERIAEQYKLGKTDREAARALGCSKTPIAKWRKRHGKPPHTNQVRAADPERAMELYKQGLMDSQMARLLGCSLPSVRRWRESNGLQSHGSRGYDWGLAMTLYEQGEADDGIRKALGCSRSAVTEWRRRNGLEVKRRRGRPHGDEV